MTEETHRETTVQHLVLYDGICRMCNWIVRFLLKRDRHRAFHFAPIGGTTAQEIAARHGIYLSLENTVFLVNGLNTPKEHVYRESNAAFRCLALLGWPWRALSWFRLVPRFIRDGVYRFVARRRFRWFGREEACPIPPPEYADRFLP